jgi:hypothetical protein
MKRFNSPCSQCLLQIFILVIQGSTITDSEEIENVASSHHGCISFSLHDDHVAMGLKSRYPVSNIIDDDLNTVWIPAFANESENSTSENPCLILLFRCMHLVSTLQVISGVGPYNPVTRVSVYFSTSTSDDILSALPAAAAAAADISPQPRLNPVPVWRPLLGMRALSDDVDVDGHTILSQGGGAAVALPAPGALLRAIRVDIEDVVVGSPAAVSEVRALAAAEHNPQVLTLRRHVEIHSPLQEIRDLRRRGRRRHKKEGLSMPLSVSLCVSVPVPVPVAVPVPVPVAAPVPVAVSDVRPLSRTLIQLRGPTFAEHPARGYIWPLYDRSAWPPPPPPTPLPNPLDAADLEAAGAGAGAGAAGAVVADGPYFEWDEPVARNESVVSRDLRVSVRVRDRRPLPLSPGCE